jgi:hypothetical protein
VRRALPRIWIVGAGALVLAFAIGTGMAAPKANPPTPSRADTPDAAPSWVADELRILRSEMESLRQRPDPSALASEVSALRGEVSRLSSAQADLERRVGTAPPLAPTSQTAPERSAGGGVVPALVFLMVGAALGWVGGRLTQRWRDRRQRIRV